MARQRVELDSDAGPTTTAVPRPHEYRLEEQIGHVLRRASQRHTALFAERFTQYGLTTLQFAALMKLYEHEALSQNHLGRLTAMDPNTIQGVVKRLENRALVQRQPNPQDKRQLTLALTTSGRDLARQLEVEGHRISEETLAPLLPMEQQNLLALLRRLT